jgi:hypothetical protein
MNESMYLVSNKIRAVLRDRGPMTRRTLQMACRGRDWTSREFNDALDTMLTAGKVKRDDQLLSVVDNGGIVDQWTARRDLRYAAHTAERCPCCDQMLSVGERC